MLHQQRVLVTGGTGYIGSHVAVELIQHGHKVMLLDNTDRPKVREGIARIVGRAPSFVSADIRNRVALRTILEEGDYEAVVHCAALKILPESLRYPIQYWDSNVAGTLNVLLSMEHTRCDRILFASSAAVYEESSYPLTEIDPTYSDNPYGQTKLAVEQVIEAAADATDIRGVSFRIFNPLGAHESGHLSEPLTAAPTGDDWPTLDGTCVRDYLHVCDVARAFRLALEELHPDFGQLPAYSCMNLGSEKATSVLDLVEAVNRLPRDEETAAIRVVYGDRRPGDIGRVVSSSRAAMNLLGWKAERSLDETVGDAWNATEIECGTLPS
jgi:UDP-glucose 4-epimerase